MAPALITQTFSPAGPPSFNLLRALWPPCCSFCVLDTLCLRVLLFFSPLAGMFFLPYFPYFPLFPPSSFQSNIPLSLGVPWPPYLKLQPPNHPLPALKFPVPLSCFLFHHDTYCHLSTTNFYFFSECLPPPGGRTTPGGCGFCLFCSLLCLQRVEQCLPHSRYPISIFKLRCE